jgi:hypothetical protein
LAKSVIPKSTGAERIAYYHTSIFSPAVTIATIFHSGCILNAVVGRLLSEYTSISAAQITVLSHRYRTTATKIRRRLSTSSIDELAAGEDDTDHRR